MDIGKFEAETSPPALEFECALEAGDFNHEWVRCSMLANYVAQYTAYQFVRREWAENLISTVTNDFLEAIIRLTPEKNSITLRCAQYEDNLLLEMVHGLRPELVQPYQIFLNDACTKNTDTLYFQLLTISDRPMPAFNQLGLIMLVHDFGARLAARLDEATGMVHTRVFISTKELAA